MTKVPFNVDLKVFVIQKKDKKITNKPEGTKKLGNFKMKHQLFQIVTIVIFLTIFKINITKADDFPSLLTQNASIAIIIDREYLDDQYEDILKEIKIIVERVLREDLKNGGLVVSYYSWTKINLRKDFSAVLSVTNCENTWEIYRDAKGENLLMMAITDPDCPRLPYEEALMVKLNK